MKAFHRTCVSERLQISFFERPQFLGLIHPHPTPLVSSILSRTSSTDSYFRSATLPSPSFKMQLITVVSALTLQFSLATAARISAGLSKRAAVTNASLIAYGTDTEGWPVAYGLDDGQLIFIIVIMCRIGFEAKLFVLFRETLHYGQPQRYCAKSGAFDLGYVSYYRG